MIIYIVKRDVNYEFGENYAVCSSRKDAECEMEDFIKETGEEYRKEFSIEEWTVKCPNCG